MNTGINYELFYEILLHLREDYHSYGRIDDSNAKLDEIVKLIMLSYYFALNKRRFSLAYVKQEAFDRYGDSEKVAITLRDLFNSAIKEPFFQNTDGTSIFGGNPSLNIQPSEDMFASRLISEIEKIDFINLTETKTLSDFDIINECFGHFVRENFRNNKEDAQYMTPAEIATPILDMIFHDFYLEKYFDKIELSEFKIMDPTCGVGTLLIEASKHYISYIMSSNKKKKEDIVKNFLAFGVIAQDKVDRMVRLSKINTLLMGGNIQNINSGNSIYDTTFIDSYARNVDLIFTNPPFGAEYQISELNFDDFCGIDNLAITYSSIPSELLMLLKCLKLLKDNGKLAIVLPDSFFSAKGINAQVRNFVIANYTINAVIEMPAVTFAQAGTRTKTSILYLTNKTPCICETIVMGICNDIGYNVKERMGVPVKIKTKQNEMELIANTYCKEKRNSILSVIPSVTNILVNELIQEVLNPSFYSADRLQTIEMLQHIQASGYELKKLSEIVSFNTIGRKNMNANDDVKHISVLHINPDSTIDFQQVLEYDPISKGRQCFEGDILFSKINPRIPRMTVVPKFEKALVCSNEFEILQASADIGAYAICFLLKTSYVAKQIENLTSGTSSSHSRIKRDQLADILIPYPTAQEAKDQISNINALIETAFKSKYTADEKLRQQLQKLEMIH